MDKSNAEKEKLEKEITEDLLKVTNVFGKLILNISENIKTNTNYSYNTGDAGDDDSIINGFVINSIILILSTANIFLPLYNKQPSPLLPISGGRAVDSSLKQRINGRKEDIVGKSASASASKSVSKSARASASKSATSPTSASASASVGIGEHSNIQKVIFTKEEVKKKQKLYKIFRKNCKIHFNSDYTQYYNATIFYRKLVYKNCIENLYALLYFYINYNKLKQENEQRSGKNGGMKQKGGGLQLPLCQKGTSHNSELGPVKPLDPALHPAFITTLKAEMETFLGQGKLTPQSVGEFFSIFRQDLHKDVTDTNRANRDLTQICLGHIPRYKKMDEVDLANLLSNPAAIITGPDFLKPDNYRLVVNKYSIHDTTPSGLKAQIEAWRSDDKLLIIPNISSILDSAEHSNGGIYDAYNIETHSAVFKNQLTYIINPAIKALKSFYISLDKIDIKITINDNNIVLTVNNDGKQNDGIVVKFGSNGISTVSGVVERLLRKDLDNLLEYLDDNGLTTQQATDISLFIKHMGDSLQFIQALYHNTEFQDQPNIENQKKCNTFKDNLNAERTIETQNETAFLTCDRSAFKAAMALNCNAVIGVGNTKCNSDKTHDKIYWRVSPLIAGLTKIGALVKFFTFCVPYPGPASQAASHSDIGSLSVSGTPVYQYSPPGTPVTPPTYIGTSSSSSSSDMSDSGYHNSDIRSLSVSGTPPGTPVTPPTYIGTSSSSSSSDMSASSGRKSASGGRKSASGGRKSASGGRKSASGGTLTGQDIEMSTSDSTNHTVANSSGLLYSPEVVDGKTRTTIYLCFTDENGKIQIDKIFFIGTFKDLDLSDQTTIKPETAKDFQKIITTIFESSLIELDSEKYDKMFDKMKDDIAKVETYSLDFKNAFDKNTKTLESLSNQLNSSRKNKAGQIINSAIASYRVSFETSLNHLKEIKKMVEDWRLKMSVKFHNRKNAIKEFMEKIEAEQVKHSPESYHPIIKSTLESCTKSLLIVNSIIQKFETFDKKQAEFTRARVKVSEPFLGNSDTQNKSMETLMSEVNSAVKNFILTFDETIKKLRDKEIKNIIERSNNNIKKIQHQIKEKKKELEKDNKKLQESQKKLNELRSKIKNIKKSNIPYASASDDNNKKEALTKAIIARKTSIKNKMKEIKKLNRKIKIYENMLGTPEKYANISFKQITTDALKALEMNMTDHTKNLMYLFEVENPGISLMKSRPSYNRDSNKAKQGEKGSLLPVIQEEDSIGGPSSSKRSKIGGKLLNKKVRIHKATSISQKTISGEKKNKITKVIKNKELLSIKKSRAKPAKAIIK